MKARTRVLLAVGVACVLAVVAGLLLLNGNVAAAIWMEGPYFPLTLLLQGSVDTLAMMLTVVALYYFVCGIVHPTRLRASLAGASHWRSWPGTQAAAAPAA